MRYFLASRIVVCAAFAAFGMECLAADTCPTSSGNAVSSCKRVPSGGERLAKATRSIAVYQEGRLTLHTDLPPNAVGATLDEMKSALRFAERHWRQRLRGSLDCYVAVDAANWPDNTFPHRLARVWIDRVGGATVSERVRTRSGHRIKATLYASTQQGAAPHEIVHGYCCQTFGRSGPDWYSEGLAMVVGYECHDDRGVRCPHRVFASLRRGSHLTVRQLIRQKSFTSTTCDSLTFMLADHGSSQEQVSLRHWTADDAKNLDTMLQAYDRSWSLCYLLLHDPNYRGKFRSMGTAYLSGHQPSYRQVFGGVHDQLVFDYRAFLKHVDTGYRVDLCSWEWCKAFHALELNASHRRRVQAARGYQATGVEVVEGQHYDYVAEGNWSTSAGDSNTTDANGGAQGVGRLEGVVLCDYQLSAPFELGTSGTISPATSGRLYVRCRDRWNELSDNSGSLRVTFSRASGNPTVTTLAHYAKAVGKRMVMIRNPASSFGNSMVSE